MTFRDGDPSRFDQEVETCWEIYSSVLSDNWGYVPMSRKEFLHGARDLKHLLMPEFFVFAEVEGKAVGFTMIVPDFNVILKRIPSGRLLPFGWFKILVGRSRLRSGRLMAMGIREGYRARSIFPLFVHELWKRGKAYPAKGCEASWILEDNEAVTRPLEALEIDVYRRWRIYERPL